MKQAFRPLIAGLFIAASMPPWGWWPLSFIGIALYASIARERRTASPFVTAFIFGIGWYLPAMAWMWFLTAPGYLIVVLLFASLHGLAARVAAFFPEGNSHTAALIVFHSLAETVRLSLPFGGVPLATLAIAHADSPLAHLAPWLGVIGLSTVVLWIGMSQHRIRLLLVVTVLIGIASRWDGTTDTGRTVHLTAIQGGGEQGTHAVNTDPREVFLRHLALTKTLQPDATRTAVVWPENVINVSADGLFFDSREYTELLAEAKRLYVPFVVGITEDAGNDAFTNAQVVIDPELGITSRYDKVRRVPFGEYMPMRSLLASLGAPTHLVPRDARSGDARGWIDIASERASVAISWEVFFGGRVNEGVSDGAGYIINPTNGSSYTWTILQTQQVASSRLRAQEQGRWLLQISPTGFSGFVGPDGHMYDRTKVSEAAIIDRVIPVRTGRTLYSYLGNGVYIALLMAAAFLIARRSYRAFPQGAS
ncbi:MAG: apolipoprotein N-acyltransferase [Actinomycetota bacterium]